MPVLATDSDSTTSSTSTTTTIAADTTTSTSTSTSEPDTNSSTSEPDPDSSTPTSTSEPDPASSTSTSTSTSPTEPDTNTPDVTNRIESIAATDDGDPTPGPASAATLTLDKTAAPLVVQPGEVVEYELVASCSSLTEDCVNFTITDTLPEEFDITALPQSNSQRTVTYNSTNRVLTIAYTIDIGVGQVGVPAASTHRIPIGMRLPAQTPVADDVAITNTATVDATNATAITDTATVTAKIPVRLQPVASKTWSPATAIGLSGDTSSITIGVRSASTSSTNVTELIVADTTPATFERFDLVSVGELDRFPDGADRITVEVCTLLIGTSCDEGSWIAGTPQPDGPMPLTLNTPTGVDLADVTGIRYRFTNSIGASLDPFDPDLAEITFDVTLRDTLRSTGAENNPVTNETISNCAVPTGIADNAPTADGPAGCAPFTILPGSVVVGANKVMFPDSNGDFRADGLVVVGQDSGVTMKIQGRNDSAFKVRELTITEPDPATPSGFGKIAAEKIRLTFPAGATEATLSVTCRSGTSPADQTLTTSDTTPAIGCDEDVAPESVSITYRSPSGDPPAIEIGAIAGLDLFGRATGVTMSDVGPAGLTNCASVSATSQPDGTGASTASDCAVTEVEAPRPAIGNGKKSTSGVTTIAPGQELDFNLSFRNTGNIPVTNVVLLDPVDPTAPNNPFDVVRLTDLRALSASPAATFEVFDPTVNGYVAYDATNAALLERSKGLRVTVTGSVAVNQTYRISYSVLLRDGQATGDGATPFRNCAAVGISVVSSSPFCSPEIRAELGGFGASLNKAVVPSQLVRPQPGLPDQIATVRHQLQNTGTSYLSELSLTDVDPDFFAADIEFRGNIRVNFPVGANRVQVDVCTSTENCAAGTFVNGTRTSSKTPGLPGGVTPASVKGLRVTFTNSNNGFEILPVPNFPSRGACPNATVCFDVKVKEYPEPGPGDPIDKIFDNASTGTGKSVLQSGSDTFPIPEAKATLTVTEGTPSLGVTKGPNSSIGPADTAPINLVITNTGTDAVGDPTIVDPLPAGLTFVEIKPGAPANQQYLISYTLPAGYPAPTTSQLVFNAVLGDAANPPVPGCTDPTRICKLVWDFQDWALPPGGVIRVEFEVELTAGASAGDVFTNSAGATGTDPDLVCTPASATTVDPVLGTGTFCVDSAEITTLAGDEFRASKWVAGDPSLGWLNAGGAPIAIGASQCPSYDFNGRLYTRFPCKARVLPGQVYDYLIVGVNRGTNDLSQLVIVDGLPVQGDTGVWLTGQSRGTQWNNRPLLAGPVTNVEGYGGVTTGYSTARFGSQSFCNANLRPPPNDTCPESAFSAGPGTNATGFRTVLDFPDGQRLQPGGSVTLTWQMMAPTTLTTNLSDPIAWNSFALRPTTASGSTTQVLPATETIKVGVAMPMGDFRVTKEVVGLPTGVPLDDFEFAYRCDLTLADGTSAQSAQGTFQVGDGETYTSPKIPAGSTCRVWETDTQGGDSNLDGEANAATRVITADTTTATIEAVNTYDSGRLAITKTVVWDTGVTAVPLPGPFMVRVKCAFPTADDLLPGYPRSFELEDGDTAVITDPTLPAGAICEIAETETQGSMTTTIDPSNAPAVDATFATVIVDAGVDASTGGTEVEITNTYTTGAVRIIKQLTGDGARWAQGPFVFEVACIDPDGPLSLERTIVLSPRKLEDTVSPIPSGDVCTVTETDPGDGVPLTDPQTITIPDYEANQPPPGPVVVTFVNDYPAGAAEVRKVLAGDAAGPMQTADFELELLCEREIVPDLGTQVFVDQRERVTTREILRSDEPLPLGAECWAAEPDPRGAASIEISADEDDPAPINSGDPVVITVTNTYRAGGNGDGDLSESGIKVTKVLEGPAVGWARGPFVFEATCTIGGFEMPTFSLELDTDELIGFINPVPAGAECDIVEVDKGNADGPPRELIATVTVPAVDAPPVEVRATNTFSGGSVAVAKNLTGPVAAQLGAATFEIALTCDWDDPVSGETVRVLDTRTTLGATEAFVVARNLPLGTECWGTETDDGGAAEASIDFDSAANPTTITSDGQTVVVTATNRFDGALVEVAKIVEGVAPSGPFGLELRCVLPTPSGREFTVDLAADPRILPGSTIGLDDGGVRVAVAAGESRSLTVPRGARCSLSEPDTRGALSTRLDGPIIAEGQIQLSAINVYGGRLPTTGVNPAMIVWLALGLVVVGVGIAPAGWRRRLPLKR